MDWFTLIFSFKFPSKKNCTAYIHSKSSIFMEPHTPATSQVTRSTQKMEMSRYKLTFLWFNYLTNRMLFYQELQLRKLWRNVMFTAIRDAHNKECRIFSYGLGQKYSKSHQNVLPIILKSDRLLLTPKHYGDHTLQFEDEYWHLVI